MIKHILIFLFCLFSNLSLAQIQPFVLDQHTTKADIGAIGDFFHDKTGELTLPEVMLTNYNNQFLPIQSEFIQLGILKGAAWVKVKLNLANAIAMPLAIQVQAPRLLTLDIYIPQINGNRAITE